MADPWIQVSTDYGQTWQGVADIPSRASTVAMSPDGRVIAVVLDGNRYLMISEDSGATWETRDPNITPVSSQRHELSMHEGNVLTVHGGPYRWEMGPIFTSTDLGLSWTQTGESDEGAAGQDLIFMHVSADMQRVYAQYAAGSRVSTDGGVTWADTTSLESLPGTHYYAKPAVSDDGMTMLFRKNGPYPAYADYVYRSTDGGATWTNIPAPTSSAEQFPDGAIISSGDGLHVINCSFFGVVHVSHDGGDSWVAHNMPDSEEGWPVNWTPNGISGNGNVALAFPTQTWEIPPHRLAHDDGSGGSGGGAEVFAGYSEGDVGTIHGSVPEPGDWSFRVRAISTEGARGAFSEPFDLTL